MNPISEEYPDMRTTLLPGLLHTLAYNLAQHNEQISIFEHGHVYQPKSLPLTELPYEYALVSGLLCGGPEEKDIQTATGNMISLMSRESWKMYSRH